MRRRRSSVRGASGAALSAARRAAVGAVLAVTAAALPLRAQGGLSTEGALFLLVPVGARTVGSGQATATAEWGTESLWGNPAGIARATRREAALHYSRTVVANGTVLALVYPAGKAGVLGFGAQLYDYGAQELTDVDGTVGELLPRSIVMAATYAATLGSVRAGVTYKRATSQLACTGPCGSVATFNASTSAFDAGLQYQTMRADSLAVGLMLRHLGLKLQVNDDAQSDPLPTRVQIGVGARVPAVAKALPGAELRWSAELVNRTSLDDPAVRLGAELGLQKQLYLRAGYASGTGEATGPAIGLGFVRGALSIDFARVFGGFSSDAGQPPTFLTLRVNW
ncbi:MAG: PorV/PorQ family protein [Gemmatimonadaceae bacterium]|nr:PorV/PorQ family protein [Gemmatimonadaceae bacterium]